MLCNTLDWERLHESNSHAEDATVSDAPVPLTLQTFVAQVHARDVTALREVATHFLVGPPPSEQRGDLSYFTSNVASVAVPETSLVVDGGFVVYPLSKERNRPFSHMLMVGRSTSNDVQILDTSISKLHCKITLRPELTISDAGSRNGTSIDGSPLDPDVPVEVRDGSIVQLGNRVFALFDAAHLHKVLAQLHKAMQAHA